MANDFRLHDDQLRGIPERRAIDNMSGITKWIITHSGGMIQNAQQASVFMLIVIALCVIGIFMFMPEESSEISTEKPEVINGVRIEYSDNAPPRAVR